MFCMRLKIVVLVLMLSFKVRMNVVVKSGFC